MKKVFTVMFLVALSAWTCLHANSKKMNSNSDFKNVETYLWGENDMDNGHWLAPRTVSCKLDLGNGWFTASVERICEFSDVMSNCMGVSCGESF